MKGDHEKTEGENFWGNRNVPYQDYGGRHMVLQICPNPWKCTLQGGYSSLCKIKKEPGIKGTQNRI